MSSREFNQDTGRAKKAAADGPVFITDRGQPAHVLLSIEDYRRLAGEGRDVVACLAMPGLSEIDIDFGGLGGEPRAADLRACICWIRT